MEQQQPPRKGFRVAPKLTKGEVLEQNTEIAGQLAQEVGQLKQTVQFMGNALSQLMQGSRNTATELEALSAIEASDLTTEGAKLGDHVMIDYIGNILNDDGTDAVDEMGLTKYFDGGYGSAFVLTSLGSGKLIPGFEEQLVGRKAGETLSLSVQFPKDYGSKEMADKKAKFLVSIRRIYRPVSVSPVQEAKAAAEAARSAVLAAAKKAADEAQAIAKAASDAAITETAAVSAETAQAEVVTTDAAQQASTETPAS